MKKSFGKTFFEKEYKKFLKKRFFKYLKKGNCLKENFFLIFNKIFE